MKFGVNDTEKGTICANCETLLNEHEAMHNKFCPHCGTALKKESIEAILKLEKNIQRDLLSQIEEALKQHSIEDIVADFKNQLSE